MNTVDYLARPRHALATTTYHESNPGHHFQGALEVGAADRAAIRRFAADIVGMAFCEGWGLYSEALVFPFMPPEGQLVSLQYRLLRAARAFLDPELQAGKIKLLAVTNSARAPTLPDLPTVKEAGFPDPAMDGLVGFFGPPHMPQELRERIAADVRGVAAADPLIEERLNATGQMPNFGGPAEFHASIEEQRARIDAAAKSLGVVPTQ